MTMRDTFRGFYAPHEPEVEALWRDGLIVIDANVLLNLYKWPAAARDDMLRVFDAVKDRLWVPYQAVLEYHRQRERVIRTQLGVFERVQQILGAETLKTALDALQLRKSHSVISVGAILEKIKPLLDEFGQELAELEKQHVKPSGSDTLRDRLAVLLDSRIGAAFSPDEMAKVYAEGEERYKRRIPPGYEDDKEKSKQIEFTYGGILFQPRFGDLLLWKEIIRHAKASKARSLMLVSDDEKADWRHVTEYHGERLLLPRAELVDEIRREGGVDVFYIYSSELFLKYAKERLAVTISENTIPQVEDVKEAARATKRAVGVGVVEIVQAVGNRRDAVLTCGSCGAENIPIHFYEGDGTPKLLDVLGVFHYWKCPALAEDATVDILLWRPNREPEVLNWRRGQTT